MVSQNSSQEGIFFFQLWSCRLRDSCTSAAKLSQCPLQSTQILERKKTATALVGTNTSTASTRWAQGHWSPLSHPLQYKLQEPILLLCIEQVALRVLRADGKKVVTWLRFMQPSSPYPKPWWPITRSIWMRLQEIIDQRHYHLVWPTPASGSPCHRKSKRFEGLMQVLAARNHRGKPTMRNGAHLFMKQWLWDFSIQEKSSELFQVKMMWINTSYFFPPPQIPPKYNRIYLISHSISVGKTVEEMTATTFWKLESRWMCDNCFSIPQETQIPSWQQGMFKIKMICTTAPKGSEIGNTRKIGNRMWGKLFEKQWDPGPPCSLK